jgi:hypothetical protein
MSHSRDVQPQTFAHTTLAFEVGVICSCQWEPLRGGWFYANEGGLSVMTRPDGSWVVRRHNPLIVKGGEPEALAAFLGEGR